MNKKIGVVIALTVTLVAVISVGVIWFKRKTKSEQKQL